MIIYKFLTLLIIITELHTTIVYVLEKQYWIESAEWLGYIEKVMI